MFEVVALLHNPSVKSFGTVPFVFRHQGGLGISGFAPTSAWRADGLNEDALRDLITGGHARAVHGVVEGPSPLPFEASAIWVGTSFAVEAISLGVRAPTMLLADPDGTFEPVRSREAVARLERWIDQAFERVRSTRGAEQHAIAVMMRWVLPHHAKTLAALWVSARDQQRELAWQIRVYRNGLIAEDLVKEHQALLT